MTPKSLLRLPAAASPIEELAEGGFQRGDRRPAAARPAREGHQARALLGQGLLRHRRPRGAREGRAHRRGAGRAALPVPGERAEGADGRATRRSSAWSGSRRSRATWAPAPSCAGAWPASCPRRIAYDYVGRQLRASPGEGYAAAHKKEQARIVRVALDLEQDCSSRDVSAERPLDLASGLSRCAGRRAAPATSSRAEAALHRATAKPGARAPRASCPHAGRSGATSSSALLRSIALHHPAATSSGVGCPRPCGSSTRPRRTCPRRG